jgi:hypothetical protein
VKDRLKYWYNHVLWDRYIDSLWCYYGVTAWSELFRRPFCRHKKSMTTVYNTCILTVCPYCNQLLKREERGVF